MPDLTDNTPATSPASNPTSSTEPPAAKPPVVPTPTAPTPAAVTNVKPAPMPARAAPPPRPPEPPRAPPPPPPPEPASIVPLVLGVLGFLLLAGVAVWQWTEIQALQRHSEPVAAIDPARISALEDQVRTLAARPAPEPPAPVDLGPLTQRLAALEQRPAPPAFDDSALRTQLDALGKESAAKLDALSKESAARLDALSQQYAAKIDALSQQLTAAKAEATKSADQAAKAGRLEAAMLALSAGKPIGEVPGAGAALQRFANAPPPTDASLRLSFEASARAAEAASDPAAGTADLGTRMWDRVQTLVTVRRGDKVLVGAPASVVLADARRQLVAGDLAGAVATLDRLDASAAKAMAGWRGEAESLLAARASLASLAATQPATP